MDKKDYIRKFAHIIHSAKSVVFFGGAGVSTESGIPDFRSKDGLYNKKDVQFEKYALEYLLDIACLQNEPEVFYEFYRQKLDVRTIQPNRAHEVLAWLESIGKLTSVITQNIDGLHQKAGSKKVHEIHGTTQRTYCMKCGMEYHPDYIFNCKEAIPRCECGGMIRPDVTLYGEDLPVYAINDALMDIMCADVLIIGGTSLTVFPANTFVYSFIGDHMIIINKDKISMKLGEDDLVFMDSIGTVLEELKKYM